MTDDSNVRVASSSTCVLILLLLLLSVLPLSAASPKKASTSWFLSIQGDRLSVNIDRVPLGEVLAELAKQAGVRVSVPESAGKQVISRAFRDLALDEGIDRLLLGHSHAVLYEDRQSPGASGVKKIREIVVLSEEGAPFSPPNDRARVREAGVESSAEIEAKAPISAALQDPDPAIRVKALDRWADQGAATPLDPLTQALVDPDESVRAKAQELVERVWGAKAAAR